MTCDEEPCFPVKVYAYDLLNGMAAVYLPMILGTHIPAIYHTSVVVYGKEYYIDQGIKCCPNPGTTKYGTPIEIIDMGSTYITPEIFDEYIADLQVHEDQKFHAHKYDLFDNNCNHFSDTVVDFLVGKNLDEKIMSIPGVVLTSPNGNMLKSMLAGVAP